MTFTLARDRIKRGELAARSGCNPETIRFYENIGLLNPPERTASGHRLYSPGDQRRLRFILRGRELGFTIEELRSLLSMVDGGAYACKDVYEMTLAHLGSVSAKIADLKKLELTLKQISRDCANGAAIECPIIETLAGD